MPLRDFHRFENLPRELKLQIWTHAALPTELLNLGAYNVRGPSEADENVYEWMNWARRGATCSISAMFLYAIEKKNRWDIIRLEGDSVSLDVFEEVCEAR